MSVTDEVLQALRQAPPGPGASRLKFGLTDVGNAQRLVAQHGADLRFNHLMRRWYLWDGTRYRPDERGEIMARAKATARSVYVEAANEVDEKRKGALAKHAAQTEGLRRLQAMVELAQSEPQIPVLPSELDADPWLLNCRNGTLDLRTGELREHRREDLITRMVPVDWDPTARLDLWEKFLTDVTGGHGALMEFLQRAVGYSITGLASEEVLFFAYGPSATGKSTFLEALRAAAGDYARTADFETFLSKRDGGGPRPDLVRLVGARMVFSLEVDEGKRLAEGLVKTVTGGDTMAVRDNYRSGFESEANFTLWLAANHAPHVSAADEAMWRRILLVPFDQVVPEEKRDPGVKRALRDAQAAGAAILRWAVEGCLAWQRQGLGVPQVVKDATADYRAAQDPLGEFLEDMCTLVSGAWTQTEMLLREYERWSIGLGKNKTVGSQELAEALQRRGCKERRDRVNGRQKRGWLGIALQAGV